ncbi:MAG: hypothetical protein E7366_00060 [Clostridiales bacterium]|nr:hypothetical protein [Clostridiales bacterium]
MKKFNRFISLSVVCVAMLSAAACNAPAEENTHTHTYATEWSSDATKHWHAGTCEHADEKADIDGHTDANKDGICDVCSYAGDHTHTYETEWSFNETNHWHAANCFHDVKADDAAHTPDAMGDCTVCGYHVAEPDVSTVAKAIELASAKKSQVGNGVIELNDYFGTLVNYIYGSDYLYVSSVNEYVGSEEWYSETASGEIFAIEKDSEGNVSRMTEFSHEISVENLEGYKFSYPVTYTMGCFYGVEGLIAGLYEVGEINTNKDFTETVSEGVYSFSYGYYEDELYVVEVSFTISDTYYVKTANVKVTSYGFDSFEEIAGATEGDATTYKVKEGEEGYVQTNYTIEQNVEEVPENKYPAEEVLMSSYKLVDAEGNAVTDSITIEKGSTTYLYFAEVQPETAIIALSDITATGEAIDSWDMSVGAEEDEAGNYAIYLNSYAIGEHTIQISIDGKAFDLKVNVVASIPSEITVYSYEEREEEGWFGSYTYYYPTLVGSNVVVGEGASVILGAIVDKGDDLSYTVTVNGETVTTEEVSWEDPENWESGYVNILTLEDLQAGTYTVVFTSNADNTVNQTVMVEVKNVAEVLNGKYRYMEDGINVYTVEFTPAAEGATNGKALITWQTYEYDEETENNVLKLYDAEYTYDWTNGEGFKATLFNGYDFGSIIEFTADYEIEVDGYAVEKVTEQNAIVGTWSYDVMDYETYTVVDTYVLTMNADGTGVFTSVDAVVNFKYTIGAFDEENGYYPVTLAANENATDVGTTTAFSINATVTFGEMFSWVTYTQEWTISVDNGEMDEWENPINYGYTQPAGEKANEWAIELEPGEYPTNIYAGMFESVDEAKEFIIDATEAGTYTVYVTPWGDPTPITSLEEYCFIINGVKVMGAIVFEVESPEVICLTVEFINKFFDYDFYVTFVAASTEDDGNQGGGEATSGAQFIVTTDMNTSSNEGEYTYSIDADGSITIYANGEVASFNDTYALTFVNGVLTANSTSYPKELTKYSDDNTSVLAGSWKYIMNLGSEMVVFDFTFMEIAVESNFTVTTDMQNPALEGEYTWSIDADGNVTVYSDGVVATNFTITFVDGVLMYNGSSMTKSSDTDTTVLAGTWTFGMFYEITFTGTGAGAVVGGGEAENNETELSVDGMPVALVIAGPGATQSVTIADNVEAGTYTITVNLTGLAYGTTEVYIIGGVEDVTLTMATGFSATITVEAGATLTFSSNALEINTTITLTSVVA